MNSKTSTELQQPGINAPHLGQEDGELGKQGKTNNDETYLQHNPNSVNDHPWPRLNPKALYGIAGRVVELATRSSEADPAAVLFTCLARFGAEVGTQIQLHIGDTIHTPRLFIVVVGNSSKSRKGTSAASVQKIFDEISRMDTSYTIARTTPGPLSSGEGIVYNVRDASTSTNYKGDDVHDPGVIDKRLFVLEEEFGSSLSCIKREGNTLSTILRTLYDTGNCEPLTKGNRIRTTGAGIGIVAHITNSELQKKLDATEALNGFGNRFLWICARRSKMVSRPDSMPQQDVDALVNELLPIVRMINSSDSLISLSLSDEAWTLWDKIYPDLSQEHTGKAGAIINRSETQVLHLAMIYAVLDGSTIINEFHLEAALAAWDYCKQSAIYIFGDHESDPIADKIINRLKNSPMSSTDIHKLFRNNVKANRINDALHDLILRGKIVPSEDRNEHGGRPRTIYSLSNPSKNDDATIPSDREHSLNSFNSSNIEAEDQVDYVDL